MDLLIYFLVFLTASLLVIIVYEVVFSQKRTVEERLNAVKMMAGEEDGNEFKEPFINRVIKPVYMRIIRTIGNAAPKSIKEKYTQMILTSGAGKNVTVNSVMMTQIMLSLVFGGCVYLAFRYLRGSNNMQVVFFALMIGFVLPLYSLYADSVKRQEKIRRSLPDLLDLLYVSVEAGLGFDMALKKSSEKMSGPLSEEINKTLNEISRGRGREEAFRGLSARTGVEDLNSFVTAVIQTEQLGSNIANMLRIQSASMRQKRRQRAEERAAKIPIKMLFPLMFFMFPSLFVVILGPAAINIFENFISLNR